MALPLVAQAAPPSHENDPSRLAPHRIKRCTYRRLISLDRVQERVYEVECLYPDRRLPIPLGDLDSSHADLQRVHGGAHLPRGRGLS